MLNSKSRFSFLFLCLAILTLLSVGSVSAESAISLSPGFEPQECWFDKPVPFMPGPQFECGFVTVPERHENPDGPQIKIPVAIAQAQSSDPKPDPLFLAQGGPGGDAFEVFSVLLSASNVWQDRDVVIFNQRGTRYAEPDLSCTESFDAVPELLPLPSEEVETRSLKLLQDCYDRLTEDGVDLSAYNSVQNAADVNVIRKTLGYDEYNFYGVSYGTLLGLHLLRDQPDGLRSVILDAVVPTNLNYLVRSIENIDRVFSEVIQSCEQDEVCRNQYPELENRFFKIVEDLNESPISVKLTDPETGQSVDARLDGDMLVQVLFQAFYLPNSYAYFPKLVANLESGDLTFVEGIWPLFAFDRSISEGMYYSVICSEDYDFDAADLRLDGVRPYFADGAEEDLESYSEACEIWRVDHLSSEVDDPVTSDIPVLLLSGQYDPITPPYYADVADDGLSNSVNIIHPTGSHSVAFGEPCITNIWAQFLDTPYADIDTSCIADIEPKEFAPADAVSFPLVGEINQLSESVGWFFGLSALLLLVVWSAVIILPLAWLIAVLRRKEPGTEMEKGKNLRWLAGLSIFTFGLTAFIFVSALTYFTFESIFSGLAMVFAISSASTPFLTMPFILLILAVLMVIIAIISWRRGYWATWARVYFTIVTIAAVAYIAVLAYGGMFEILI